MTAGLRIGVVNMPPITRDDAAMQALNGLLANSYHLKAIIITAGVKGTSLGAEAARQAFEIADAMIIESNA